MLFAKQDIDQLNLKVRAGRALPERFQGFFQRKHLLNELGSDLIVDVDEGTKNYVLVEAGTIDALKSVVRELELENERLKEKK